MIAWTNFFVMLASMFLFAYLYVRSVRPAELEKEIGPKAYIICTRYRVASGIFMFVVFANYVFYYFYPPPIAFPMVFPWSRIISVLIAIILAVPASYFMIRGLKDAGEEALIPKKEHTMYQGIYKQIRHPQAWEAIYWFVIAFALNSPFLACVSVVGLILEYWMVMSEEPDLIIRFGKDYEDYQRTVGAFFPRRRK